MQKDSGHELKELAVDGGMSNSDLCMQVRQQSLSFPSFFPPSAQPNLTLLTISPFSF